MDNKKQKKTGTCEYVFEKGARAGEMCGENTLSHPRLCWQHKTKNVSKLLVIDTEIAVDALRRQRKILQQDLKRLRESAAEVEKKLAADDPNIVDVQKIRYLDLK